MKRKIKTEYWQKPRNPKQARYMIIRQLRISGCSWGRIGELIGTLEGHYDWGQMFGQELYHEAATYFGENSDEESWD